MSRRYYNLYPKIWGFANLYLAFQKAARSRRRHPLWRVANT